MCDMKLKLSDMKLFNNISARFLLLCTLFYYSAVYDGMELLCYFFYYLMPLIYILIHYKEAIYLLRICFRNRLKFYLMILSLMAVLSLLIPFFSGTGDYTYFSIRILQLAKESIKLVFLVMVYIRYISPKGDVKLFLRYFVLATCIYILGTIVIICIPGSRELLLRLNKADENVMRLANMSTYITRFGWCGFSGFTYTLKCSLAVTFMCYILYEERYHCFWENCCLLFLCMLGNLFYGRIGVMVSGLFFLILVIRFWRVEKVLAFRLLKLIIGSLFLITAVALCSSKARAWLYWAFQSFINLATTGSMETTSSVSLENMYFMPKWKTLLLGDARYTEIDGTYYMGTDVGLLRALLFGGVGFQLLRYTSVYILLRQLKDDLYTLQIPLIYLLGILLFIFELKGEVICPIITVIFVLSLLASYAKSIEEKK